MTGYEVKDGKLEIKVNPKVYNLEMLYSTAYVFLDDYFFMMDGDDNEIVLTVKPRKGQDLEKFADIFMNELVSITNYFNQLEKNKDVINAVLQRALFSASPKLVEDAEEQEINKLLEEVEQDVNL